MRSKFIYNNTCKRYLILLMLISTLLFSGCDPRSGQYPFQKAESWYSESPQISLQYTRDSDGYWDLSETLIWEDEEIDISVAMHVDYYCVYPADSNNYDDRLFSGRWGYRGKNLVLKIEEDFIFNGAYSKIVLHPQEKALTP